MKTELLYGIHPVAEALAAGRRPFREVLVVADRSSKRLSIIESVAASKNIPVRRVPMTQLNRIAGDSAHQGTAARVGPYPLVDLTTVLEQASPSDPSRLLVLLDAIVDPQNLGAIIRTALAVGVEGLVIPRDRAAGPTPAVSKASAGALEHLRLVQVTNLSATIRTLQGHGWWVYGMDRSAERSVFEVDLTGSVAMVIGGEGKGIRPLVKQGCDLLLSIPQRGPVGSLNASVAAAVALYEAYRQLRLVQK
ncbi:MAG: 23S rRNA (guanosine(2251)-2'-O)-methyltransferase RlmB [Desulfobacterales bacterium]|jgi:23S rRNA (guanosine2251-2'-O)-methyltransferase